MIYFASIKARPLSLSTFFTIACKKTSLLDTIMTLSFVSLGLALVKPV